MPRPKARPLFELAGQWIAIEPGRDGFYRFWNDVGIGRTRRASLGTADIERAKERLAEIVVRGAPANTDTYLSVVLESYFLARTDHLPSKAPARHAGKLLLARWGSLIKVSDVTEDRQKDFIVASLARGNSLSYAARNLSVLAAALSHAKLCADILMKEGSILDNWPDLNPKPRRKPFEPTDEELARLFRQKLPEDIRRWLLNSMATLGRPTAVLELAPAQRDRAHGMITLNKEGRRQNKKFRPTVREPRAMTKWLNEWEAPKGKKPMVPQQRYCIYAGTDSLDSAIARACASDKANLPKMALYSLRHRGTTVLRNAKVPKEQIDYQLGHVQGGARTTQDYGQFEPGYLAGAAKALDAWIARVLKLAASQPKSSIRKAA